MRVAVVLAAGVLAFAAANAAASAPRRAPAVLRADVAEWSIVPSTGVVASGRVRIVVRNLGEKTHRIALVRTRRFADRLSSDGMHVKVAPIARTVAVPPGATASFVVRLTHGSYALFDDLPWHYWLGTAAAFTVE
jgi:uncharacterized cupredoxin-like copper-binding protein